MGAEGGLSRIIRWVGERFSRSTISDFRDNVEVAGVSGDLASPMGYERFTAAAGNGAVEPYALRVTHVHRREDGVGKIVHRHGELAPPDQSLPAAGAAP